jgi:hypothetical protein
MLNSAQLASLAIDTLTGRELSPSTVDLLTLEGIRVAAWLDEEEKLGVVSEVLARYGISAEALKPRTVNRMTI